MRKITHAELQKKLTEMLEVFDNFCTQHQIEYCLTYGTLLGAVRHQGFIPWDDDVDVFMKRKDYNRFIELWKLEQTNNSKLTNQYKLWVLDDIKNPFYNFISKIYDTQTHLVETLPCKTKINYGLFLDIFVLDNVPDDPVELQKFVRKHHRYRHWGRLFQKHNYLGLNDIAEKTKFKFIPSFSFFTNKFNAMSSSIKDEDTRFVSVLGLTHRKRYLEYVFAREYFSKTVRVPFEHLSLPIPSGYDAFLTQVYGDYMTIPPEEDRVTHSIEVYLRDDAETK